MPWITPQGRVLYIGQIRDGLTSPVTARALFEFHGELDDAGRDALPTPQCDSEVMQDDGRELPGPGAIRVHPDSGEVLYSCKACPDGLLGAPHLVDCRRGPWWDEGGNEVVSEDSAILATGYAKVLLLGSDFRPEDLSLYDRETKLHVPVVLPAGTHA